MTKKARNGDVDINVTFKNFIENNNTIRSDNYSYNNNCHLYLSCVY